MTMADDSKQKIDKTKNEKSLQDTVFWIGLLSLWVMVIFSIFSSNQSQVVPYSSFLSYLDQGKIDDISISPSQISGTIADKTGKKRLTALRVDNELADKLAKKKVTFSGASDDNVFKSVIGWVIPPLIFIGVWIFFISRFAAKDGSMSAGLMPIERNKARIYVEDKIKITFADVAGVDEAKEELQEVINFLKEPERYSRLGGHLPKGILLVGPPGTGKTLLARAVAGEAGVPFFSISGSEFVEMFVGVGAARVRDLFAQAKQKAPCIIFIDELDALGRARGLNPIGGGHDEKEQTLNQLLVELDGFDPRQGVVFLAATNRPEILDPALLRAGRFDRHVLVDRPDKAGRVQILGVHLKGVTYDPKVNIDELAAQTPGFTGADLANFVNEAVLLAARRKADAVEEQDFTQAIERIIAGLEKKNRLPNQQERKRVAYHESGHALVALSIPGSDPVQKISIIPRGIGALGYTMQRPTEDRFLMSQRELENKMTILLGGRAAELLIFADVSTGAADDLSKATDIARSMATRYGMASVLGPVALETEPNSFLQPAGGHATMERSNFSEETARELDIYVKETVNAAFERASKILNSRRPYLEAVAQKLLQKEALTRDELLLLSPTVVQFVQPGDQLKEQGKDKEGEATNFSANQER